MPIKRVDRLDGGLNELGNPINFPDDTLQESSNYEILGDGKLTRRKDPVEYGDDVSGDSLKTKLADVFTQSILQISPPYYPVKKLSDMTGDFLILVYGRSANIVVDGVAVRHYELYMCYENDFNTWVVTKVDITGIEYTVETYLEFFIGDDKLIITDTYNETTNFPHYVKVDAEGELITGLFSIKSPTNKPTLLPTTEYNSEEFEEDADDVHLDDCGIVQCVYTVVTKDGNESNPSPTSNSRMMQFFKKDLTDKNDVRWLDNFQITNLSVPVLTGDLAEQLKYFNVYFRVIRYSEGEAAEPFYFSQRFEIVDKNNNEGDTGNGYIITVPQDESILLSYENDIAPYAKHAAEVSGIVGLANIREKIRFPFDFDRYCPIEINNINNKNYVDAIVAIRLYDTNSGEDDLIEDLDLSIYSLTSDDYMTNLDFIRIYDNDLTTPIKVVYQKYNGAQFLDIFVKIPLLTAGQVKHLYLCFNIADSEASGVTTTEYKTLEYGEFKKLSNSNVGDMFDTERVKSNKTVICSPMDYQEKEDEILNLADVNNPGVIKGAYGEFTNDTLYKAKQLSTGFTVGKGGYSLNGKGDIGTDFSEIKYGELPYTDIPDKIALWGSFVFRNISGLNKRIIFYFNKDSSAKGIYLTVDTELNHWMLRYSNNIPAMNVKGTLIFNEIPIPEQDFSGTPLINGGEVFIALSIDRGESVSLYIGDVERNIFYFQKVEWNAWSKEPDDEYFTDQEAFHIGYNNYDAGKEPRNAYFFVSQFQLTINKYYSAENDNDLSAIYNIANFMPGFEAAIGQKLIIEE